MSTERTIRAFFRAAKVAGAQPPYDTLHLKVTYPAKMTGNPLEQDMGIVPADAEQSPFPVVVFFSGVNCRSESYQWLATQLAGRGIVVVTFDWVAENLPGMVALTPGVDLRYWQPDTYGKGPTASALPTVLAELEQLQAQGLLEGLLNLQQVVLGGHSAGGRVAIENANPDFFPQVVAAFAYAAHSAAPVQIGYAPKTILPLPSTVPMLLMGGTQDGVIANSSDRYGMEPNPTTAVIRTFEEALAGGRQDTYLVLLEGANHFSAVSPFDATTGRPFLDLPAAQPPEAFQPLMAEAIALFIEAHVRDRTSALEALDQLLQPSHPLIHEVRRK